MGLTIPTSDTRHPHHSLIIYSRHLQNLLRKLPSHPDLNPLLTSLTNFHRSQWFRSALTLVKSVKRKREEEEEEEPVQEEEAPPAQEEEAAEEAEQEESTDSDTDVFDWNALEHYTDAPHDTILRSVLRRHYTLYPPTPPDSDQSPTGITADSALSRGAWRASWVFPNAAGHETDSDEAPEYLRNVGADGEGERDGDGNSDGDGENEPRYEEGPVVFSGEWIGPGN
ncbi:hypothetical protein BC829DRAFT_416779 [Chytridium lagenaria]|nr:hypothetical protein BC829DRAFT_416779 [Chytridium lagenaria]